MIEAIGALVLVIIGLLFKGKLDKNTIENQAAEIHMHVKKGEITEGMNESIKKEGAKADEAIENINTDDWRTKL